MYVQHLWIGEFGAPAHAAIAQLRGIERHRPRRATCVSVCPRLGIRGRIDGKHLLQADTGFFHPAGDRDTIERDRIHRDGLRGTIDRNSVDIELFQAHGGIGKLCRCFGRNVEIGQRHVPAADVIAELIVPAHLVCRLQQQSAVFHFERQPWLRIHPQLV